MTDHAQVMIDLIQEALGDYVGEPWTLEPDFDLVSVDKGGRAGLRLKLRDGTIVIVVAAVGP